MNGGAGIRPSSARGNAGRNDVNHRKGKNRNQVKCR